MIILDSGLLFWATLYNYGIPYPTLFMSIVHGLPKTDSLQLNYCYLMISFLTDFYALSLLHFPLPHFQRPQPYVWLDDAVVRALDLRLEVAGSILTAALSSFTLDKLFTHIVQCLWC